MVVGKGLLAKAFHQYNNDDSVVIFASGISNSKQVITDEYEREKKLLTETIKTNHAKFIYFSTCSVYDQSLSNSPYVLHKKEIEKYIQRYAKNYVIFRLPIVVSNSPNPHTLTNYLFNAIGNNETILVYLRASRYLIDVDDVVLLISKLLKKTEVNNTIIDITFDNRITVLEIVSVFENILNKKAKYELMEEGDCYFVDNAKMRSLIHELSFSVPTSYNHELIEKYYGTKKLNAQKK